MHFDYFSNVVESLAVDWNAENGNCQMRFKESEEKVTLAWKCRSRKLDHRPELQRSRDFSLTSQNSSAERVFGSCKEIVPTSDRR